MKPTSILCAASLVAILAIASRSQTPAAPAARIAIFDTQAAVNATHEGQTAFANLETKYNDLRDKLEKKQAGVQALQDRLRKSGPTLKEDARAWLEHEIDAGTRAANHDAEDLAAEANLEQAALVRSLRTKMMAEVEKYAAERGYSAVFEAGGPQNPLLWSTPAINITQDIVGRYEKAHPPSHEGK